MAKKNDDRRSDLAKRASDPEQPADDNSLPQYVTPLVTLEHQVGGHVVHALQQENTVAVLTTVVPGPAGQQCIISVGLDAERLDDVQELLAQSQPEPEGRVPCVGFHCFLPKQEDKP